MDNVEELNELQTKLSTAVDENNQLRKGLEEILDSIKEQDGKSDVKIESETLTNLLEILDSK